MREVVGIIQGNDVIYVPERDIIFCKNTSVNFSLIKRIIKEGNDIETIPEKNLTVIKDGDTIHFGCLTTTIGECLEIVQNVNKLKHKV